LRNHVRFGGPNETKVSCRHRVRAVLGVKRF
jgi:hypothetical protein